MDYSLIIDAFYLYKLGLFLNEYLFRGAHGNMLISENMNEFEKKIDDSSSMLEHPYSIKKKPSNDSIILTNTVIKGKIIGKKFAISRFKHKLELFTLDYIKIPKNLIIKNNIDLSLQPESKKTPIKIIKSNSNIQISKPLFQSIYPEKKEKNFDTSNLLQFSLSVGSENELIFFSGQTTYLICDLVYSIKNQLFTIKNPGLITHSLSYQVSLAKLQNKIFERKGLIMLVLTIAFVEYRFWKMRNVLNFLKRIKDLFKEDVLHKRLKPSEDINCIICMVKPREIILKPCGHLVCCEQCSNMLNECPICRKAICGSVIIVNESNEDLG